MSELDARDHFAIAALTGLVAQSNGTAFTSTKELGAAWAYEMADAMMTERQKQKPNITGEK